ncbi:MAG: DUF4965 domain-containing protein [Phycisphaerae bacterium]
MLRILLCIAFLLVVALPIFAYAQPAIPLITHDPYISVWSLSDELTADWPRHWTGAVMGMTGMVRIDGKAFRWCGPAPRDVPPAEQVGVEILPAATTYTFRAAGVEFKVAFVTPVGQPGDMALVSESISTITISARSIDSRAHQARAYLDLTGEWCTHNPGDAVGWSRHRVAGLDVLSMGKIEQPVLQHAGDHRRIDWGRVYLATKAANAMHTAIGGHERSRRHFAETGESLESDDLRMPRAASDDWPVLAATVDLETPDSGAGGPRPLFVGYDEGRAIELHERRLRPLWQAAQGEDFGDRLKAALARTESRDAAAAEHDAQQQLLSAAERVGGREYARLIALAYRQVLAGHKIVADWDGTPLMFSKENTSNGCIATVDVIYPACPFFLYHSPEMLRAQLRPLLRYAASPRWRFPFAPHDLGTYPKANGQVYGGGETSEDDQMPVEESGNMLIMLAALARVEGRADFAQPHLEMLERWAVYLREHGLDPTNQLCTDDFAGHLARNANLSAKTCVALGAFAQLLKAAGRTQDAERWRATAEEYATRWRALAAGPRATVLAFDVGESPSGDEQPTWSQKYNLIWDRVLELRLFPAEALDREMAWYRTRLNRYGLPLDSRKSYTKTDWTVWSACLTGRRADFDAIMKPVYEWSGASPPPSRVPLTDWYETTDGKTMGMYTRTVVGGIWMPLLMDKLGVGWR